MTVPEAPPAFRVAPGVVNVENSPLLLGVRPLPGFDGVWQALIDDRDGGEPKVILTQGPKVVRFIETYCVLTQARWAGDPFRLLAWQKALLCELFELTWDPDREWTDGAGELRRGRHVRRYHEALIGTPKKNGKSDWLAALGIYFLVADGEPSPIVIAAAANETSARLVYTPAKTMVELSPGARCPDSDCDHSHEANLLAELVEAGEKQLLLRSESNAELRKVPASPAAVEGLSIHVNLMDEWHEWTTPAAEQTAIKLQNGTALRPDYMNIRTTTAGHDLESMCGQDYEFGYSVAAGETEAPEWFFRWYEAPKDVDWRSEEAVRLANPSYGALAQWSFYEKKLRRALEAIYRRYFLNQWTETETSWLPSGALEACFSALDLLAGADTVVGWDASSKSDSTALVAVQRRLVAPANPVAAAAALAAGEQLIRPRIVARCWLWERPYDPHTRRPQEGWKLPLQEVKDQLYELARTYRLVSIQYDPMFITWEAQKLEQGGLPMLEFPQYSRRMTEGSQSTYEHIVNEVLAVDPSDTRFRRHMGNAVAHQVRTGSAAWRLVKGNDVRKKMDAAIALAMAIWGLEHPGEEKPGPKAPKLFGLGLEDED